MNVIQTKLKDCVIIEPKVFGDERGFFLETFQAYRYADVVGINFPFVQDNHSRSQRGVLRGLIKRCVAWIAFPENETPRKISQGC